MVYTYYRKKESEWKRWFAWKPVPIGRYPLLKNGQSMVWLQLIERKWLDSREGTSSYEYRLLQKGTNKWDEKSNE